MANYVNTYIVRQSWPGTFTVSNGNSSNISIDEYLKEGNHLLGHAKNIMIDKAIIDWLDNHIKEGDWFLDLCSKDIWFKNNDDCWKCIEWLEEHELKND